MSVITYIKGLEERDTNTSLTFFVIFSKKTHKLRVNYIIDLQKLWLVQIIENQLGYKVLSVGIID